MDELMVDSGTDLLGWDGHDRLFGLWGHRWRQRDICADHFGFLVDRAREVWRSGQILGQTRK